MTDRSRRREPPQLTNEIPEDDDQIMSWAQRTLDQVKGHRALTRRVLERQAKLQALADQNGWAAYMTLEQAVNSRAAFEILALIRAAQECGVERGQRQQRRRCR